MPCVMFRSRVRRVLLSTRLQSMLQFVLFLGLGRSKHGSKRGFQLLTRICYQRYGSIKTRGPNGKEGSRLSQRVIKFGLSLVCSGHAFFAPNMLSRRSKRSKSNAVHFISKTCKVDVQLNMCGFENIRGQERLPKHFCACKDNSMSETQLPRACRMRDAAVWTR